MTTLVKRSGRFLTLVLLLGFCRLAAAHPMGNFSVNHYSKISLETDRVRVTYFIDLAEIPTYQELQQAEYLCIRNRSRFRSRHQLRCGPRRGAGTRSHSPGGWQTDSSSAHLQWGHLSSRRRWSSHDEDGLCV